MKMRALAVLVAVVAAASFTVPTATAQPAQGSAGPTVMAVDGFCEWVPVKPFCG